MKNSTYQYESSVFLKKITNNGSFSLRILLHYSSMVIYIYLYSIIVNVCYLFCLRFLYEHIHIVWHIDVEIFPIKHTQKYKKV